MRPSGDRVRKASAAHERRGEPLLGGGRQDDDRQTLVRKRYPPAIDRHSQTSTSRPVVDDQELLAITPAVAPNVHALRDAAETSPIEVDRVPAPPVCPLPRRDGEGERLVLGSVWLAVLRRMDDVELRSEQERLAFRPVVPIRSPPATIVVALAEKEDAIVEQVPTERRERRPG